MLFHIVAMAKNRVIGIDNQMPWHFKEDFQHFKKMTTGQTVLMGLKTFESIGDPLPNRNNFVLDFNDIQDKDGVKYFKSINEALNSVETEHCFIIGGASVYKQTINMVDGIYLTNINLSYNGDSYYPEIPDCFGVESQTVIKDDPFLEVIFYKKNK